MFKLIVSSCLYVVGAIASAQAQGCVIDFFDAHSFSLAPMEDRVACWAASMSAALKSKGVNLPQSSIKIAINGHPYAQTLQDPSRLSTFLDRLPFREGRLSTVTVTDPGRWVSWDEFCHEIDEGNPFIVGYWTGSDSAHVVVVYGVVTDLFGNPGAYKVWDPMPGVGRKLVPVQALNQHAWFYVILKSARLAPTRKSHPATEDPDDESD